MDFKLRLRTVPPHGNEHNRNSDAPHARHAQKFNLPGNFFAVAFSFGKSFSFAESFAFSFSESVSFAESFSFPFAQSVGIALRHANRPKLEQYSFRVEPPDYARLKRNKPNQI